MSHPYKPGRVTVSLHRGKILPPKTLNSILRQAGMSIEELKELL